MSNLERVRDFPDDTVAKTVCSLCRGQSRGTVTCGKVWGVLRLGNWLSVSVFTGPSHHSSILVSV